MNNLETNKKILLDSLDIQKQKTKNISTIRTILLLAFVVDIIVLFSVKERTLPLIIMAVILVLFIIAIFFYRKEFKIQETIEFKIACINDHISRTSSKWKHFSDNGMEFRDNNSYYQSDLDLFGRASLYQFLNVGKTAYGRLSFANSLKDNEGSLESLKERQEAITELSLDLDKHTSLETSLRKYNKKNSDNRVSSMDNALNLINNEVNYKKWSIFTSILFVVLNITTLILMLTKVLPPNFFIGSLIISFILTNVIVSEIRIVQSNLIPINDLFYGYDYIIKEIINTEFTSPLLIKYQNEVKKLDEEAIKIFNVLNSIISSRRNILFNILINATFSLDTWILISYTKWQKKYAKSMRDALKSIGEIEALLSLATIKYVKEDVCLPKYSFELSFTGIRHPLIEDKDAIANDLSLSGLNIITGSNMSGKTTFMRSVGINYLLFKAGTYTCATSFNSCFYKLFTSMKVVDDVSSGISTFYGEVLRIKEIIDYTKNNQPMLVLIDEIFKGTNTIDRIEGAQAVAKKLNKNFIISIITTHDFELCEIDNAKNYHFLEHYENDKILFDYKIRSGKSTTKNAIFLLRLAGIMDN